MLAQLVVLAVGSSWVVSSAQAANSAPKALPYVFAVAPGGSVELNLRGYDADGDALTVTLTQLPETGALYDLAKVYSVHGHAPAFLESGRISSAGHVLPAVSKARVIFSAPASAAQSGQVATFKYTVSDGKAASAQGRITIIADTAARALVASDFRSDADGWTVAGNAAGGALVAPVHERSSYNGVLNHFVFAEDALLDIDAAGRDKQLWRFQAPSKFLGFQAWAYGGALAFSLGAFAGDFHNVAARDPSANLAVLACTACARGAGMRFAYRLSDAAFDGSPQRFSLLLSEKGSWLKLPKGTLEDASAPSQCEFVEMLDNLSGLHILGDHTSWYETVGLDDVHFAARGVGRQFTLPVSCVCTVVGTQC